VSSPGLVPASSLTTRPFTPSEPDPAVVARIRDGKQE
jgi:hypothetical protein